MFAEMVLFRGDPPDGAARPPYDWVEGERWWPTVLPNIWLGVSVEDQHWANIRIPQLLKTPAAVRFLSCEPLLSAIDVRHYLKSRTLDWLITGGESGPGARPMDLAWARFLVDQCRTAGVAPFVKQLGSVWARAHTKRGLDCGPADSKGGDMEHWPPDLRIREMPEGRA